jgi:hypothetical protein
MKKTIEVKKIGDFLEIDGKWYFPTRHAKKGKALLFTEVDKSAVQENIKNVIKILKPYLSREMVLEDALSSLRPRELMKLLESLKTGKKPNVKRSFGCVDMIVNGISIPIR